MMAIRGYHCPPTPRGRLMLMCGAAAALRSLAWLAGRPSSVDPRAFDAMRLIQTPQAMGAVMLTVGLGEGARHQITADMVRRAAADTQGVKPVRWWQFAF